MRRVELAAGRKYCQTASNISIAIYGWWDHGQAILRLTIEQYCMGGCASVLSDYNKTGQQQKILIVHSNCHHLFDTLNKFRQNHVHPAVFERPACDARQCLYKYPCVRAHTWHMAKQIPINPSAC